MSLIYLSRISDNLPLNPEQDWVDAELDVRIEAKVKQEAYLHYLNHGDYPLLNWLTAKEEINQRINFLAF
jgi:hypothetical protein